jgi:Ras-related protein Rab-18
MGAGIGGGLGGGLGGGQMLPMSSSPGLMQNNNVNMMGGSAFSGNQENNNYHFRFKIALVGDSGVGKTTFLDAISQTLGSVVENEESSELHIKTTFYIDDAYQYKIVYFDMPGKERHHKYVHKYVNGSTAIIYLFDVTKRPTFERIEQWITECERACEIPIKILVGNKIDILQQ